MKNAEVILAGCVDGVLYSSFACSQCKFVKCEKYSSLRQGLLLLKISMICMEEDF